jgi:hypothetical protein
MSPILVSAELTPYCAFSGFAWYIWYGVIYGDSTVIFCGGPGVILSMRYHAIENLV